jgi:hypothetical protein
MRSILELAVLIFVVVCGCNNSTDGNSSLQFGPPNAEAEIREVFLIHGSSVSIEDIHRVARERHINYEILAFDHSIVQCNIGNVSGLRFEQYPLGMAPGQDHSRLYIVIYDQQGRVLCIETRHSFREI